MDDNKEKEILFLVDEDLHARFRAALAYDKFSQKRFISAIIEGYIDNNIHIRRFIDEAAAAGISIFRKKNKRRDRKQAEKTASDFRLNEQEVQNIFDIIESENPDL